MVTKLRRQLKNQAKKRAHRKNVEKRREQRMEREALEKREAAAAATDEQEETTADPHTQVAVQSLARRSCGLTLEGQNAKKKKNVSRKQQKRKDRMVEKGQAVNDMLAKKLGDKKVRVKERAVARNAELH